MTPNLLNYLCEPITKAPLLLVDAVTTYNGMITLARIHFSITNLMAISVPW